LNNPDPLDADGNAVEAEWEALEQRIGTQSVFAHRDLCYVFDKLYEFQITEQQLASAPPWNPATEPNPPLPAAAALRKVQRSVSRPPFPFAGSDFYYWVLENLSLIPLRSLWVPLDQEQHWAWSARYRLRQRSFMSGAWPHIDCWVLMDGTVIQPLVEPFPRPGMEPPQDAGEEGAS
jgi:hypothetical protein